jgi:hypothetical protein
MIEALSSNAITLPRIELSLTSPFSRQLGTRPGYFSPCIFMSAAVNTADPCR